MSKGQTQEEMGLLEAVRGLTDAAKQLNTRFGDGKIPLSVVNTPGLHYYLEHTESIQTPTWKRRKHLFCPKAKTEAVKKVRQYAHMTDIAYLYTRTEIQQSLDEMTRKKLLVNNGGGGGVWEIIHSDMNAMPGKPAHYFTVFHPNDNTAPEAYLVIRGTFSIPDIITDTQLDEVPFYDGSAHSGMQSSGIWIAEVYAKTLSELENVKRSAILNKPMKVKLIGHSLGGGAAAIATIHLRRSGRVKNVECFTIGSPPVVSEELASECADYVTSVVCDDDIVPRLTRTTILNLAQQVSVFDWTTFLRRDLEELVQELQYAVPFLLSSPDTREKLLKVIENYVLVAFAPEKGKTFADDKKESVFTENKLFQPGSLLHMYRTGRGFAATWVRRKMFAEIAFSRTMLDDHFCEAYVKAADEILNG
eukprot:CAMPEP_0204862888 /NCGR_PEP_ID=MMETSP1348-20121228/2895_1 /ASSEMBLY_ACC=CAM_ASM_000700 /TAXON_ID=215587 /ORGANISM="Aplanochytrium stocchinoi, Strain GSBS06" /LENGTH=418 /DNA_ID=CAMNT_0052013037 /DNA_START=343 /DNA_END=1599 /DNA_ORIENTATION=+